ncbi:hypothetical protein [Bacillus cereus]|uniref:hypothetical protein n=1 Tax=Bacillus cereus TaxID=1396 RepID=UPI000B4B3CF1|nr:hypothetical protein [Bacillus cereus]
MVDSYSIEIKGADNKTYLFCDEDSNEVLTFATYEETDDYNYELEDTLLDGLTSRIVKTSKYFN